MATKTISKFFENILGTTQSVSDNSTKLSTTAFVKNVITNVASLATNSVFGVVKLYTTISGSNQDGSVTQKALNDANLASLSTTQNWTKSQNITQISVTSSGNSIDIPLANSNEFLHTLTENTTLSNPTDVANFIGYSGNIVIIQHASAAKTLAFGSYWKSNDGLVQTISTTLDATNLITFHINSATNITYSIIKNGVT